MKGDSVSTPVGVAPHTIYDGRAMFARKFGDVLACHPTPGMRNESICLRPHLKASLHKHVCGVLAVIVSNSCRVARPAC